ncbi:TIGR02391 family protein [uncultured Arthrobacter sp.]|uniref:TIGR02391 family protein n=1 Tax=uncultured Arthrobacter sp. TaxID=114050 RepID=UPI00260DEA09|nr:TIGR02391 family protein [uncultured Arthrobacter sp.]
MSGLSVADKVLLESVLGMSGGYVLDFSNESFAAIFHDLGIDVYDAERYPGFGDSKANRLRALWRSGTKDEVSRSLNALIEYIDAKRLNGYEVNGASMERMRAVADGLAKPAGAAGASPSSVSFTTEATVTNNKIQIEIHADIYAHISRYLATEDYFHAVEESYKVVREALREKTGSEKATDAFKPENLPALFGHEPAGQAEKDFFDGVKYLNMAIQFLRNEKSHTLATSIERNLALHYISLASLSYDLITRYVSDELITQVEDLIAAERRTYSATRFYRLFEGGRWLNTITLPNELLSPSVRRVLKEKWLRDADFTRSFDHSNIVLMRLQVVADALSKDDVDALLELPTVDSNGYSQEAGTTTFLEFMRQEHPETISAKAEARIAAEQ